MERKKSYIRIESAAVDLDKAVLIDKVNIYYQKIKESKDKLRELKGDILSGKINVDDSIKKQINIIINNIEKYKRLRDEILLKIKDS